MTHCHDRLAALAVARKRVVRQTRIFSRTEHDISQPGHRRPHGTVLSSGEPPVPDEHGGAITMGRKRQGRGPYAQLTFGLFRQARVTRARQTRPQARHAREGAGIGITRESE